MENLNDKKDNNNSNNYSNNNNTHSLDCVIEKPKLNNLEIQKNNNNQNFSMIHENNENSNYIINKVEQLDNNNNNNKIISSNLKTNNIETANSSNNNNNNNIIVNKKDNNNNNNSNRERSQSNSHNYIMIQYHIIESYLKSFVHGMGERWITKIQQIKDIISNLYSNPIDLRFDDLDIGTIDEESLYSTSSSDKLLNTYSLDELKKFMEKFGITQQLLERNYHNPQIVLDYSDPFVHRLEVVAECNPIEKITTKTILSTSPDKNDKSNKSNDSIIGQPTSPRDKNTSPTTTTTTKTTTVQTKKNFTLIDIFVRRKEINVYELLDEKQKHDQGILNNNNNGGGPPPVVDSRYIQHFKLNGNLFEWKELVSTKNVIEQIDYPIKSTIIEWLCLQDPNRSFTDSRPPLPGQLYPGLGVTKQINNLLVYLAINQYRDCLLNKPFRFYNAFMYQTQEYFYIDPSIQAIFLSLLLDLESDINKFGLSPISWAFEFGCVKEKETGSIVKWEFHKQLRPISNRMKNYFKSKLYTTSVQSNMRKPGTFYIDWSGHPSLSHFTHPTTPIVEKIKE